MSNFWARTITGLSMVFILLAAIYFSGWVFAGIFLIILILGLWEFYGLIASDTCHPQKYYGMAAGIILYILSTLVYLQSPLLPGAIWVFFIPFLLPLPLLFLSMIIEIYRKKPNPLINVATTIFGFLYIALPFSLLNIFGGPEVLRFYGLPVILVGYFAFTWIYDTGAYLYGKQFGKHKFFERISPKKTWEGTIAGVIITYLAATGFIFLVRDLPAIDWLALATLVVLFGTHGDLFESLIKRSLNIKDSGKILPGHGGILDRFDTILLSAPFVFLYFFLRNTF
ncbi:MAG: phosphatidate cytidylyltransferase [Bacteroidales bacterium]|jgi:phosphatidate cytidylyltransferase|nr:phosphatidate cytidylyltransferase [Bacteroidales bacterium]